MVILSANLMWAFVWQNPCLMRFLLIKNGHHPFSGSILNHGPGRFMCFSLRFILALMPLCSAPYWCFCHVVKIYGAISVAQNGLVEVSDRVDLWLNMARREKGGESNKIITYCLYSDWSHSGGFHIFYSFSDKGGGRKKERLCLYELAQWNDSRTAFPFCICLPLTISSHLGSSTPHDGAWKPMENWMICWYIVPVL